MTMTYKQARRSLGRPAAVVLLAGFASACTPPSSNDAAPGATSAPAAVHPAVVIPTAPGTTRLPRAEHPLAKPAFDRGRLDASKRIANLSLVFKQPPAQKAARSALVDAQLDESSPLYHHWLVPETYRARFGARPEDITRATEWLAAQGFEVHGTSPTGNRITFSAKVGDLERAFQTEMHHYMVGTTMHYAMATAPAMPSELAATVLGIHNTHDFFPRPLYAGAIKRALRGGGLGAGPVGGRPPGPAQPDFIINYGSYGSFEVLGPPDWAAAYDVAKLYNPGINGTKLDGTGITIAVVGEAAIAQSDVAAFRQTFGLPEREFRLTVVPNTGPAASGNGAGGEAILDVEWSGGVAKGADINYVVVGQDDYNVDDATFYIIEQNLAPLVTESYGSCEGGTPASDADITEEYGTLANLMGITYMAAAGDAGATDCIDEGLPGLYVDMPGSYPGVTSVGGTQFPDPSWNCAGDLTGYPTEAVWNEFNNPYTTFSYGGGPPQTIGVASGGGGISSVFPRPAYQSGVPACQPIGTVPYPSGTPMRQVPDVSFSAASGTPGYYVVCTPDSQGNDCGAVGGSPQGSIIGGTSASAPSFAGIVAILNQAVGDRLGNVNPKLYQLESTTPAAFHDVTQGNNEVVCGPAAQGDGGGAPPGNAWPDAGCAPNGLYGYAATPGYDCASGIGSLDAFQLVSAWLGATMTTTTLVPTPTTVSEGTPISLAATVTVDGTNANPVTGLVTFAFETFTGGGVVDLSWELGSVAITGGTASSGTATLSTVVPAGLVKPGHQQIDVVAYYGGDQYHLASQSTLATITYNPLSFAVSPMTASMEPNGVMNFSTTGGVTPVRWFIQNDTTYALSDGGYYLLGAAQIVETTGVLTAGPNSGYIEISALDNDGVEALGFITVGSPTGSPPPWNADAGPLPAQDGGPDANQGNVILPFDAGTPCPSDAGLDAAAHDAHVASSGSSGSSGSVGSSMSASLSASSTISMPSMSLSSASMSSAASSSATSVLESSSQATLPSSGSSSAQSSGASTSSEAATGTSTTAGHEKDAGPAHDGAADGGAEAGNDGGCGCELATGRTTSKTPVSAVFGLALGFGLIARRRRIEG
jgi:hypothetical protein